MSGKSQEQPQPQPQPPATWAQIASTQKKSSKDQKNQQDIYARTQKECTDQVEKTIRQLKQTLLNFDIKQQVGFGSVFCTFHNCKHFVSVTYRGVSNNFVFFDPVEIENLPLNKKI